MNDSDLTCNSLIARAIAPYIYLIRLGDFIYVGETQRYPFHRWHEHFSEFGTFTGKIAERDPDLVGGDKQVRIYWLPIREVEHQCTKVEIKRVTQYLEHLIHLKLYCNPDIVPRFSIISDTKRTAPTRCGLQDADALASRIAKALAFSVTSDT